MIPRIPNNPFPAAPTLRLTPAAQRLSDELRKAEDKSAEIKITDDEARILLAAEVDQEIWTALECWEHETQRPDEDAKEFNWAPSAYKIDDKGALRDAVVLQVYSSALSRRGFDPGLLLAIRQIGGREKLRDLVADRWAVVEARWTAHEQREASRGTGGTGGGKMMGNQPMPKAVTY